MPSSLIQCFCCNKIFFCRCCCFFFFCCWSSSSSWCDGSILHQIIQTHRPRSLQHDSAWVGILPCLLLDPLPPIIPSTLRLHRSHWDPHPHPLGTYWLSSRVVLVSILGFYIKGVLVALLPSSSSSSSSEIAHKLGTLHPSLVHAANNNKKENSHKKNKFQGGDRWRSVSHTAPLPGIMVVWCCAGISDGRFFFFWGPLWVAKMKRKMGFRNFVCLEMLLWSADLSAISFLCCIRV